MVPKRTCIGCRAKRSADEMVRICLAGDGQLHLSASSNGRGAWICKKKDCFTAAMIKGRIERALRVSSLTDMQKQLSSISEVLGLLG